MDIIQINDFGGRNGAKKEENSIKRKIRHGQKLQQLMAGNKNDTTESGRNRRKKGKENDKTSKRGERKHDIHINDGECAGKATTGTHVKERGEKEEGN